MWKDESNTHKPVQTSETNTVFDCFAPPRIFYLQTGCEEGSSAEVASAARWAKFRFVEQCDCDEEKKNTKITKTALLIEVKCLPVCSPPPQYKDFCLNRPHVEAFRTPAGWMRMIKDHSYHWKILHTVPCLLEYRHKLQNKAVCVCITWMNSVRMSHGSESRQYWDL